MKNEEIVTFKDNSILYLEGELVSNFFIIKKGIVRLVKETENSIEIVSIRSEGDFVGEVEFFVEQSRLTSAVAVGEVELVRINLSEAKKVIRLCPAWVNDIMATLGDRYSESMKLLLEHNVFDSSTDENFDSKEKSMLLKRIDEFRAKREIG